MIHVSRFADVDAENPTAAPDQTDPKPSLFREGRFFLSAVISKFTVQFNPLGSLTYGQSFGWNPE